MGKPEEPRLVATRNLARDAALEILQDEGVLAVTHGTVSAKAGISRSTLYRHWPRVNQLRNDALKRAASPPNFSPRTNGPAAATDREARALIGDFMEERIDNAEAIFAAAEAGGELSPGVPVRSKAGGAIAFRVAARRIVL